MIIGLLQLLHLRPVFADTGGYPWAGAQCVDGTNCSTTYNWGYSLPCPSIDPNCLSYPYPNGTNPTAGMGDTWGYGVRNCTSYVAWKINQVFGKNISGWGDAKNWANSTHGYTVDNTPSIGAIAVWQTGGGGHGHVAYVYAVNNGIASLDEYNSGFPLDSNGHPQWGLFYSGRTTASNSAGTPYRYIHIGTVPSNQVNTPASISFNGALNVFKIGGDGNVYQNYWNGTKWNGWSSLGGSTAVNNLAVIVNGSALNIFQLNANGQVYTEYNSGNGWSGWASLGGHRMVGSPKVIMYGSSQMDVFALDTNKVPYLDKWTPSGWSGWTSMGNYMASGASPAAIMYGSSEMDLFYRGGDNNIYKNTTFDGSSWGGFGSLGAPSGTTITGNPSVLSYTAEGEYDIYVNTTSNHIYKRTWNGAGWSSWTDMGGSFVGNPYAIQYGSDMNLFARGTDNRIYHRYWSYSGQFWSGWGSLGGNLASDPFALQYGSSELDVFATGTDGKTDHDTFTPTNGWGGFSAL